MKKRSQKKRMKRVTSRCQSKQGCIGKKSKCASCRRLRGAFSKLKEDEAGALALLETAERAGMRCASWGTRYGARRLGDSRAFALACQTSGLSSG